MHLPSLTITIWSTHSQCRLAVIAAKDAAFVPCIDRFQFTASYLSEKNKTCCEARTTPRNCCSLGRNYKNVHSHLYYACLRHFRRPHRCSSSCLMDARPLLLCNTVEKVPVLHAPSSPPRAATNYTRHIHRCGGFVIRCLKPLHSDFMSGYDSLSSSKALGTILTFHDATLASCPALKQRWKYPAFFGLRQKAYMDRLGLASV